LRRSHDDLDRALARAIAQAFVADAHGASTPEGIISWAAEGLARSRERELAIFAAMDACGPAQPASRQA
jgi:flagellar motor component MotA